MSPLRATKRKRETESSRTIELSREVSGPGRQPGFKQTFLSVCGFLPEDKLKEKKSVFKI